MVGNGISFKEPPIAEVVLGRTFLSRPDLLVPHYGDFWNLIRDEFPKTAHAQPIIDPNEIANAAIFSLPRVWFISEDDTRLVQIQQNRFHFNWRETPARKPYIRFPAIQSECIAIWTKFDEFVTKLTGQPLQPMSSELTYTNLIAVPGSTAVEIAKLALRDAEWSSAVRFLQTPKAFTHNYTFELPDGHGHLQVAAAAVRRMDNNTEAVKLDLTVKGKHSEGLSFEHWSKSAHDFLVAAFKDLTNPEMHQHWKLEE